MKKTLLLIFILSMASIANGQNINTKDYKFEMTIPQDFQFKLLETKGYAKIRGYNTLTDTKIYAYAFTGEEYTRANIANFGVEESGVEEGEWKKVDDGENENGFAWWDTYEASAGEEVVYAVIAKNKYNPIHYLFFAQAMPKSFENNAELYIEWAMSCQGLK